MKLSIPIVITMLVTSWVLLAQSAHAADAGGVTVVKEDEGFAFQEGPSRVMFYQLKPKSLDGKYERANYVHPLYDLRGNVLTEDFPADHLHQRGVFWAWHQLSVDGQQLADAWALTNWKWEPGDTRILPPEGKSAAIQVTGFWKSPLRKDAQGEMVPLVKETTTIRAFPLEQNLRKIDFDIRLLALQPNTRLGGSDDEKGYSGFSVRIKLPADVKFIGQAGAITPKNTAVDAGPWMNMVGSLAGPGLSSGVAVLCHPGNPGYPQRWILRNQKSMQNAAWPGREPVMLPMTQPLVLRYRLIVHDGQLTGGTLPQFAD